MEHEITLVGSVIGSGFEHTSDLYVMKYDEVMRTKEKDMWKKVVEEEYESFVKHKIFKPVKRQDVPSQAKIMTTT